MKTKLYFFALPFCLGLVLTLVFAACSGDDGGGGSGSSSNSSNPGYSSAPPDKEVDGIEFGDFSSSYDDGSKFYIIGQIKAKGKDANILWLKFEPASVVTFNNSKANGYMDTITTTISLGLNSYVDFEDQSIKCGSQSVTIYACADEGQKTCGNKSVSFTKPSSFCAQSSSSAPPSSSSEAKKWKFEASKTVTISRMDETVSLDNNSVAFKFTGDDEATPDLIVTSGGGTFRPVVSFCGGDDEPVAGKEYVAYDEKSNAECLGDAIPTSNKSPEGEGITMREFYFIYSGNNRYLLQFTREDRSKTWPKICTYWKATESPK